GSPGAIRECPHCRETILESAAVCPACRHYLRFDPGVDAPQMPALTPLRIEGSIRHPADGEPWEYTVVVSIRNNRGEEIAHTLGGSRCAICRGVLSMAGKVIPFDAPTMSATQAKILDTAEALFMEHGFEATSLRQITAAAGVNIGAVNYHFGSKEELFQTVLTRRLDPMNQERLSLLARFEREAAPRPLSCEKILGAMFIPA